jgi:predicted transcriptional regulator
MSNLRLSKFTRLSDNEKEAVRQEYENTKIHVNDLAVKYNIAISTLYRILNQGKKEKKKVLKIGGGGLPT